MIFETNIKINNSDKRLQELKKDNSVVVFGTGNFGKIISYGLKINNINILGFGDNNRNNWGTKFDNFNVYSIENLKKIF
jgi:NADH/NAD ratio-sensing transcriptional regulator Rex